jgi:hypothetical protein
MDGLYLVTMHGSGEPLGAADLAALERNTGRSMPPACRRFLLRHNGGRPLAAGFTVVVAGVSSERSLDCFLGITGGSDFDHDLAENIQALGTRFAGYYPVAYDLDGKMLLMQKMPDGSEPVYFYDHETWLEPHEAILPRKLVQIAPDFDTFLRARHDAGT